MSDYSSWGYGEASSSHQGAPYEPEVAEEAAPATPEPEGIYAVDAPYLDLEGEQELQRYHRLKDRLFNHTMVYDANLIEKIGMDTDFDTIWKAVGWESFEPIDEQGSRLLTIQFLCTLDYDDERIFFHLFGTDYSLTWGELAHHLGFHYKCAVKLDASIPGFDRNSFWEKISGRVEVGPFKPLNTQIQHPTLRLMHRWISMSLFPAGKVRWVHSVELKLLYAIVHKFKVAPVKEMCLHWRDMVKKSYAIDCTSIVTRIANAVGALDGNDVEYIPLDRPICDLRTLTQGHTLKADGKNHICFFFAGYVNKIRLPNPNLYLYNCDVLTFDLKTPEEARREEQVLRATRGGAEAYAQPDSPAQPDAPVQPPQQYGYGGWEAYQGYAGYSGWEQYPQPAQTAERAWSEAGTDEWERQRQYTVDSPPPEQEPTLASINARVGQLQIQTNDIRNTLGGFMQSTTQWQQQYGQRFDDLAERLRIQQEEQRAYWRSQGYYPGP
ncbi:unnamed protein product [Urochloa humidicola]